MNFAEIFKKAHFHAEEKTAQVVQVSADGGFYIEVIVMYDADGNHFKVTVIDHDGEGGMVSGYHASHELPELMKGVAEAFDGEKGDPAAIIKKLITKE